MGIDDRWLLWRLRSGDPAAYRRLISEHHVRIYSYLIWLGADRQQAEDLTQETYAKAWRGIAGLKEAGSLHAWLLRIARNEFLQDRRRFRVETAELALAATVPDGRTGALEQVEESDRDRRLREAVGRLDASLTETIVLHFFQSLKLREISSLLDLPVGTVKSRLNRALETLRHALREEAPDVREESTRRERPVRHGSGQTAPRAS